MTELPFMDPEARTAARIVRHLDREAPALPAAIRDRLRAARCAALDQQKASSAGLSLAGIGREIEDFWFLRGKAMMLALLLFALLGASDYWSKCSRASELEDVDSALLSDDLPIDAYLDHGFDQWLKHAPGSDSSSH